MAEEDKPSNSESSKTGSAEKAQENLSIPLEEDETPQSPEEKRFELLRSIVHKETFIDPLDGDEMATAYSQYDRDPEKITDALIVSFQSYCRKCIREAALIKVKNELPLMKLEEAENYKVVTINMAYEEIKNDSGLEQLLMMMLFKNRFWTWSHTGLKEIFNELREQPGNKLNSFFNLRFHKLKGAKNFNNVGELVIYDVTVIINNFKARILKKDCTIF